VKQFSNLTERKISWIRHRFMDPPWLQATFQFAVGGALVCLAGILTGSA